MLDRFQIKECADPRHRIYSLLSLCSKGVSSIPVDYAIDVDDLAYHVLRSHPGPLCLCLSLRVAWQLGRLPDCDDSEELTDIRGKYTPWIEEDVPLGSMEQD